MKTHFIFLHLFSFSYVVGAFNPTSVHVAPGPSSLRAADRSAYQCGLHACPTPPTRLGLHKPAGKRVAHHSSPVIIGRGADRSSGHVGALRAEASAASSVDQKQASLCKKRVATIMAFLIGWADLMLVTKFGCFTTMMTGNTLKTSKALLSGEFHNVAFFVSTILAYNVGVAGFRRAELSLKERALKGFFAPIVTLLMIGSDFLNWRNPAFKLVPCVMLACAYGIINSVGSEITGTMTFVVTGAMTKLTNAFVDRISRTAGRKKLSPAQRDGNWMSAGVIAGFFSGVFGGAAMLAYAPQLLEGGIFGLIGLVYGMLFLWVDRGSLRPWWTKKDGELCTLDEYDGTCK